MGIHYLEYATNDIDEMFDVDDHICKDLTYMQLSAGPLEYSGQYVKLDGIELGWHHYGQRLFFNELPADGSLGLGIVLRADGPFYLCTKEITRNSVVAFHPAQTMEYANPRNTKSLVVKIKSELKAHLGLSVDQDMIKTIPPLAMRQFVAECRRITAVAKQFDVSNESGIIANALRDDLLIAFIELLDYWVIPGKTTVETLKKTNKAYEIFRMAEAVQQTDDDCERLSVPEIAQQIGISKRTLYYAFRKWLGCSPQAYYRARQLNTFRNRLLQNDRVPGEITRLGHECGFTNIGRLAQLYQRQFGEKPSDTIRRKKRSSHRP